MLVVLYLTLPLPSLMQMTNRTDPEGDEPGDLGTQQPAATTLRVRPLLDHKASGNEGKGV
jgi:hypothetical protein